MPRDRKGHKHLVRAIAEELMTYRMTNKDQNGSMHSAQTLIWLRNQQQMLLRHTRVSSQWHHREKYIVMHLKVNCMREEISILDDCPLSSRPWVTIIHFTRWIIPRAHDENRSHLISTECDQLISLPSLKKFVDIHAYACSRAKGALDGSWRVSVPYRIEYL